MAVGSERASQGETSGRGWLLLLLLLGVALVLRLWKIGSLPPGFHYDEAFEAREAWHILNDPSYRPIFPIGNNTGVPPLHVYVLAGMMGLFRLLGLEVGPLLQRLTTVILGMLGIGTLLGAAWELRRLEPARHGLSPAFVWFAGGSLALIRWHVHYSRMGLETLWVPTLFAAILWLLLRAWRTGGWLSFVGLGLAVGVSPYTYYSGWVLPILTAVMVLYMAAVSWLGERRGTSAGAGGGLVPARRLVMGLLPAALVAVLVVLPLAAHFYQNPDLLFGRLGNTADTEDSSRTFLQSVLDNTIATARMFGPFGHPGDLRPVRNIPGDPVLNYAFAIPFYLGVALSFWRIRRPAYGLIWIALWGLALPGLITESAPHFTRILGVVVPTVLLIGVGLDWIWRLPSAGRVPWRWAAVALLLAGGAISARDYFVRWASLPDLDHAFNAPSLSIGRALAELPKGTQSYITPRHRPINTVIFPMDVAGLSEPLLFDGNVALPFTGGATTQAEVYAVVHEDDPASAQRLAAVFPDLRTLAEIRDAQGALYATIYERPAGSPAQISLANQVDTVMGDGIRLAAWEVQPATARSGESVLLVVHWQTITTPSNNWRILVQLVQEDGAGGRKVVAEHNNRPGEGTLYTVRAWQPGRDLLDEYLLELPEDVTPGEYQLEISLYRSDEERFPAEDPLLLGTFTVTP